ncbi:MAG: DEAD/DEAH box helicase, partial [Candidatus Korarchaeota archaeon]|nr:DEAD/DEAH box helicase [Candidatus Korarchaeota archaeon]
MLGKLCSRLRATLEARGIGRPTPIQAKAFTYISLGAHVVISSPTGTGKTEAALIPIYDHMCRHGARRISVLYVTPLRALNRDILRRVLGIAGELGIDVALRHGDTTPKQRRVIAESPPHILVTTPETLQYLLLDARYRAAFRRLRWIIVDELHELMGSKRGSELTIVLERLEHIAGHRIQRIGLSATLGRPEEAAMFLGGPYRHVHVVAHSGLRELEITV